MGVVLLVVVWLAVGALVGVIDARHGAWKYSWMVDALFGPFAIPLAIQRRHQAPPEPTVLAPGRARRGPVDLLIGFDGSASSMSAASVALELFGPRVRRVMLATVLDVDAARLHTADALHPVPWPEEEAARVQLEAAATDLRQRTGVSPGSVILAGEPADALEHYAIAEDYEVIVVGCRGKGLTKLVLGSCASSLASRTKVPALLIPTAPGAARSTPDP